MDIKIDFMNVKENDKLYSSLYFTFRFINQK